MAEPGTLYLVATPIGNLGDMSARALEVLGQVEVIASESVLATRRLLSHFELSARVIPYREADREAAGARLLEFLTEGHSVALVSEAGTPAISDPGRDLVARCHAEGMPVTSVPGPSALTSAVALSGLPGRRLAFEGFLPRKGRARARVLEQLGREARTVVLYVSPHSLAHTLEDLIRVSGPERPAFLVREMTKRFEESLSATLGELLRLYSEREPRGEYVLVLAPVVAEDEKPREEEMLREVGWLADQGLGSRQASAILARYKGWDRKQVYRLASD